MTMVEIKQFLLFFHPAGDIQKGFFGIIREPNEEAAKAFLIKQLAQNNITVTAPEIWVQELTTDNLNMIRIVKPDGSILDFGKMEFRGA